MSPLLPRPALTRVARVLALGPVLVALAGCYRGSSALEQASPAQGGQVPIEPRSNGKLVARHFPGVDVIPTRTGGFFVRIHSALVGAGEPLYLIDNAPVTVDPRRGIDWVKLDDVVRIRVLKDPSETAVYGPRGVNGIVLITTRQALPRRGGR